MSTHLADYRKVHRRVFIFAVLAALAHTTHGQSYFFSLSQREYNLFGGGVESDKQSKQSDTQDNHTDLYNTFTSLYSNEPENNNTIVLVKSIHDKSSELSQTAMDVITIVWYVATFLALAAFFLLMACSDRRCHDAQRNVNGSEAPIPPPPTPSPSYSEFAPPSYETVMKMQHASKTSIFVIPFAVANNVNKDDNNNYNNNNTSNISGAINEVNTPTTPTINFYTINELQKEGGS